MERLFNAQQVLESWNKSCKAIDDVDQEAKDIVREALELKIAEEQGLLLRLPVAIGSTIYHFEYPTKIDDKGTEWSILDKKRATIKPMKFALCHLNGIGKLYFLTKEEAEQALKQMGE